MARDPFAEVRDLLSLEADLLDRRRWRDWLDLYVDDCVYWVPSWATEDETTSEPELEVNMIYIVGKPGLEARIFRIASGDAFAESPLARTTHLVDTIRLADAAGEALEASAKWLALSVDPRWGKQLRGGWYEYALRPTDAGLRIARKKIVLLEDVIDGTIDVHQI